MSMYKDLYFFSMTDCVDHLPDKQGTVHTYSCKLNGFVGNRAELTGKVNIHLSVTVKSLKIMEYSPILWYGQLYGPSIKIVIILWEI